MSPKNTAEMQLNRIKAIALENRETGRRSEERCKTEILLNLLHGGTQGK
jgi:hypothetical protein